MRFLHKMRKTHFAKILDPGLGLPHTLLPLTPRFVVTVQHETRSKRLGGLENEKRVRPMKNNSKQHKQKCRIKAEPKAPLASANVETDSAWMELIHVASTLPLPIVGDEASVAEHYGRCRKPGIRIARRLGVEDPEAVFHEAYLSVLNRPDPEPKAWAYLPYRIKSRAQSAFRSKARRSDRLSNVPPSSPLFARATPEAAVQEWSWLSEECRHLVAPLDHVEVQGLVLFFFLEWSIEKIAAASVLGSTKAAVKNRLFRIRKKLRRFGPRPQPRSD